MTSKISSHVYYLSPLDGKAVDIDSLRNEHDTSKVYMLVPIMELNTDGKYHLGFEFGTCDEMDNGCDAQIESDFKTRICKVYAELAKKAIFAEFAIICDVNPIQFVCSHKCQKQTIIKAFSGYEGFDAEKSFINH